MVVNIVHVLAQKNPTEDAQPIVQEGKQLFKSELASWIGTDLFLAKYQNRKILVGIFPISKTIQQLVYSFPSRHRAKLLALFVSIAPTLQTRRLFH